MSSELPQDPETPYQAAEVDGETSGRQGKLFFGLCDMRVATIGANVLNIVSISIGMVVHMIRYLGIMPLQAAIPAFVLSGIAIFGAVNFEAWAVAMAAIGFGVGLLVDIWWLNFFGIIMGCIVLYPTATFGHEIYKGIMTKETYRQREEFVNYPLVEEKSGIKKEDFMKLEGLGATIGAKLGLTKEPEAPAAEI